MAIIGDIRDRAGVLVLIFVGLALVAFLLMDVSSSTGGNIGAQYNAGSINGKDINIQTYDLRVSEALDNFRNQSGTQVDEATTQTIRENTWNSMLSEMIVDDEYDKLGISIGEDEMADLMMGNNAHRFVKSAFTNPETGQFDNTQVRAFLETIDDDDERGSADQKRTNWNRFFEAVQRDAVDSKYKDLVKKASFMPDFLAMNDYAENNHKVSFDYVALPYATVAESELNITDADLSAYLNANKNEFKDVPLRSTSVVEFPIIPTNEDSTAARKEVSDRKQEFRTTEDVAQLISLYSETPYNSAFIPENSFVSPRKGALLGGNIGNVVGPYLEDGKYVLAKLIDRKNVPDSVECRHILIDPNTVGGAAKANQIADSLITVLNSPRGDFDYIAADFSADNSNKDNGGYLNWAKPGQMVPEFNDLIFYDAKPKEYNKVATQFGVHIVEVLKKRGKTPSVRVGYLSKEIEAGPNTLDAIYREADKFAGQNRTPQSFNDAIKAQDLIDRQITGIGINDYNVEGVAVNARELVKWLYGASQDEVSTVFSFDDKYVVAKVDAIKEKGVYSVDGYRSQLEEAVKKQKRAENLIAQASGSKNLNQLAKKMNTTVKSADDMVSRSAFLPEDGSEPTVVGAAFALKEGDLSAPIKGENGVYVVKVRSLETPDGTENLDFIKSTTKTTLNSRVDAGLMKALRESFDLEDNRHNFY